MSQARDETDDQHTNFTYASDQTIKMSNVTGLHQVEAPSEGLVQGWIGYYGYQDFSNRFNENSSKYVDMVEYTVNALGVNPTSREVIEQIIRQVLDRTSLQGDVTTTPSTLTEAGTASSTAATAGTAPTFNSSVATTGTTGSDSDGGNNTCSVCLVM